MRTRLRTVRLDRFQHVREGTTKHTCFEAEEDLKVAIIRATFSLEKPKMNSFTTIRPILTNVGRDQDERNAPKDIAALDAPIEADFEIALK